MSGHPDLHAMARRVIDANHHMTLATQGVDGGPRLSPVYYTAARCTAFYGRGVDTRQPADPSSAT